MPNDFYPLLLGALCPDDRDEAIRRYLLLHQKLEGFFRLRGMYDPATDADETFDRVEEKLAKGYDIPDITRFSLGVARNIVRERLRNRKREEGAWLELLGYSQDKSTAAAVEKIANLMMPCFRQLPNEDQRLLIDYCNVSPQKRAEHRGKLAEALNLSISALRIRVTRLRRRLQDCVKARSKKQ
jgi:DNA-directed RNA polymerase specialized sigma24 family protein